MPSPAVRRFGGLRSGAVGEQASTGREAVPTDRADIVLAPDGTFSVDREGVGHCFGCGQANEAGLRLRFRPAPDGGVETSVRPPGHFAGVEGVLHGGIQATVLDEVMGVAAQLRLPPDAGRQALVTAELALRYRRPVPTDGEVRARARVVAIDGAGSRADRPSRHRVGAGRDVQRRS